MKKYISVDNFIDDIINLVSDECIDMLETNKEFEDFTMEYITDYYDSKEDEFIDPKKMAKEIESEFKWFVKQNK